MLSKLPASKSPNSMPPLRASARDALLQSKLRKQARFKTCLLLLIIAVVWLLDVTLFNSQLTITEGVALGAGLNWLAQTLFTWCVFYTKRGRMRGGRLGRHSVNQLYAGQLIKWLTMLGGFSVIFLLIKPLATGAVLSGFLLMQMGHFIALWHFR